jgi:hypothetical protein
VRALRGIGALLLWLLATLLLVVAVILSVTVVLPVGLLLGALALRLYRHGLGLILPRKRDLQRAMRKAAAPARKEFRATRKKPRELPGRSHASYCDELSVDPYSLTGQPADDRNSMRHTATSMMDK